MQADDSYAEYVAARWSMLYRLAVLLVGEAQADEVTREALVRAYLSWPHRPEDEPADEEVKGTLARVALAAPSTPPVPGDPAASLDLLPRRQRAVVVLRWSELLSDADVARILGHRHDAVVAEAEAALGTLGLSGTELTTVLTAAADAVVVPFPPTEALLARGHEARRHRRWRALRVLGAAAVVLALALATGTYLQAHPIRWSTPPPIPDTLAGLPKGKPPRAAYMTGDTLHLPGDAYTVLDADPTAIAPAGRWTYVSFASGTIVRVDNDELKVTPVTDSAAGPVVADQRGRYVAWVDVGYGLHGIVILRTGGGHPTVRRQEFPRPARAGDPFVLAGVSSSGDVVVSYPAENLAWVSRRRGEEPVSDLHEIQGLGNGVVQQVARSEVVVQYPPSHFAVGRLAVDAFLAEEDLVATAADFADPRGRRVLYADTTGHLHVGRRGAGSGRDRSHDLRLRLPRLASGWAAVTWEDDDHVLLDVADASMPQGALVRCDVGSGSCQLVVRFHGEHLLAQ